MRAVVEPALARERLDVGERAPEALVGEPERHRAEARRVDEHAAAGQQHELAGRGRVAAALVGRPHRAGGPHVLADERLTSVDFPTPDAPISATVRPGRV